MLEPYGVGSSMYGDANMLHHNRAIRVNSTFQVGLPLTTVGQRADCRKSLSRKD